MYVRRANEITKLPNYRKPGCREITEITGRGLPKIYGRGWVLQNPEGRRNLSVSQLGILSLALEDLLRTQAEANLHLSPGNQNQGLANLPKVEPIHAREDAGKALGIAEGTVKAAHAVQKAEKEAPGLLDGEVRRYQGQCKPIRNPSSGFGRPARHPVKS